MSRDLAPLRVHLGETAQPDDVVDSLALVAFLDGREPFARSVRLQRVRPDHCFVPSDAQTVREAFGHFRRTTLVRGPDWTMRVTAFRDNAVDLLVTAAEPSTLERVLSNATRDAVEPADDTPDLPTATIGFWYRAQRPVRRERTLDVTQWDSIRQNYSRDVATAVEGLMHLTPENITGRLLLLHGPPGTGKTTALRALTYEWRTWCQVDYILDPERLFNDADYLMTVAFETDDESPNWRMIVLEDCDELIRAHAKRESGQSLARLLNIADGLPGQGAQLLMAITTNEPLAALHPAIVRPGRCFAQIEIGRLSPAEARAWLGGPARCGPDGVTLAELYEQRGDLTLVDGFDTNTRAVGQYL